MTDLEILEIDRKKIYLKRYRKNIALINRLKNKITDLDDRLYNLSAPKLSDMPRGGTPVTEADLIAEKDEIERRIIRLKDKSKNLKREILDKIDEVEDCRYAEILEAYFIECKDFETIAEDMCYNLRHIMRLYAEGVNAIELD